MKILNSKWLEKSFFIVSSLLFLSLLIGFIIVGGYMILLFIAEMI